MTDSTLDKIAIQSAWYSAKSIANRSTFVRLKSLQLVLVAAVPVVSVASPSNAQRWINAGLGALIGIIEGFLQLGQYQQNWLLYRATRESLKREEFLYSAEVGPYTGVPNPQALYVERCDAIISGEHNKWLVLRQQADSNKKSS